MRSILTNLVTPIDFEPIRCAATLCHFRRTRNGYAPTHFIFLSSTEESSGTIGYVVVPERFGQNGEQAGRNQEPTKKKASFVPSSGFTRCKM